MLVFEIDMWVPSIAPITYGKTSIFKSIPSIYLGYEWFHFVCFIKECFLKHIEVFNLLRYNIFCKQNHKKPSHAL